MRAVDVDWKRASVKRDGAEKRRKSEKSDRINCCCWNSDFFRKERDKTHKWDPFRNNQLNRPKNKWNNKNLILFFFHSFPIDNQKCTRLTIIISYGTDENKNSHIQYNKAPSLSASESFDTYYTYAYGSCMQFVGCTVGSLAYFRSMNWYFCNTNDGESKSECAFGWVSSVFFICYYY